MDKDTEILEDGPQESILKKDDTSGSQTWSVQKLSQQAPIVIEDYSQMSDGEATKMALYASVENHPTG